MAEDEKKLYTGNLEIGRDRATGRLVSRFIDEDPNLGERTQDEWRDLDSAVQEFFGYSSWKEYKKENMADIKKSMERDKDGQVTQAKTLHPFHVAYAFEEFEENISVEDYTLVGLPKTGELAQRPEAERIRKLVQNRKGYFKKGGFLDQELKNPQEKLINKNIIDRIKKQFNLAEKYKTILGSPMSVMHPYTVEAVTSEEYGAPVYWIKNPNNYQDVTTLDRPSDKVLGIDKENSPYSKPGSDGVATSGMLEEQSARNVPRDPEWRSAEKKRVGVTHGTQANPKAGFDAAIKKDAAREKSGDRDATDAATRPRGQYTDGGREEMHAELQARQSRDMYEVFWDMAKIADPFGVLSYKDLIRSYERLESNQNHENSFDFFLACIAVLPTAGLIGALGRVAKGTKAVKAGRAVTAATKEAQALSSATERALKQGDEFLRINKRIASALFGEGSVRKVVGQELEKLTQIMRKVGDNLVDDAFDEIAYVNKLKTYQSELGTVRKNLDSMKNNVRKGPAREYLKGHTKAIQKQIDEINVKIKNAPEIGRAFKTARITRETYDSILNSKNLDDLKSAVKNSELSQSAKKAVDDIAKLDDVDLKALKKMLKGNARIKNLPLSQTIARWATKTIKKVMKTVSPAAKVVAGVAPALARAKRLNTDKARIIGIPDVDIDPSNIELFLLPVDWYRSPENFLTEKEKLVARRVKIGIRGYITANTVAYATRNRKVAQVPAASEKSPEAALSQKAQEKVQDIELPAGQHNLTPEQTRKNQLDVYSKEQIADEPNLPVPNIPYSFIESKLGVPAAVWDIYRNELARIESGGDYKRNRKGKQYDGRYQIGADERNAGARHIGVDPPGNSPEEREQFRNNPELQEMVLAGMTYGNHDLLLNRTTLTDKYRQIEDPIERIKILAYAHNQGYKNTAEWLETGESTVDGLGTDGTEFYNAVAAALSSGEKVPTQEMKAIIFGHSQTGRFGETLKSKIEGQGGEVFPRKIGERVNSSKSDLGLAKIIKNISPDDGPFTHAYLFLGGNTWVPGTDDGKIVNQAEYDNYISGPPRDGKPDYDLAKEEIIDHVVDTLEVPRENILVILPPVNRDNAYSASRKVINDKAEQVFKTLGIAVNPQITGVGKNFDRTGDGQGGVHIRTGSGLERRSSYSMLRRFTSDTDEAYKKKARTPYQINRLNKRLAKKHGWSPQDFGADAYDEDLIAKIKRFQKDSSLEVDGIAGLDTAEALGQLLTPSPGKDDTEQAPVVGAVPEEDFTPETPQGAPELSNAQARARLVRFKKQYGDYLTDNELREAIATAESQNIDPGQYIRGLLLKDLSDYENSLTRASNNQQFLERFDSTGGVTVLDPRKAYVMPEIIPWLKGLQNVDDGKWLIGDISLPLGGNEQDYARDTVVGGKSRHVRFKHNSHQNGADIDINLPLKGGRTNEWNQDIKDPGQLDEEKIIKFLKHFKSDSLAKVIFLNKTHVHHLRKYARTKYGRNSEEYSVVRQSLRKERGHEDHMHARFNGGPSGGRLKVARARLRGASAPTTQVAAASAAVDTRRGETIPRWKKIPGKPNISYILGDLEPGGQIYAKRNENRLVASGASMNKPILALVQLLKYRNEPEKQLNKKELDGLLAYTGGSEWESNKINRLVSKRLRSTKDRRRWKKRMKTIGTISKDDAKTFLNQLGLDPNMKIRHGDFGNNEQTAKQFFDFMRLIHDEDKLESLGIGEEASTIVNYMKRNMPGTGFKDRESRRWPKLAKQLNRAGLPISSMYGKGGLIKEGLHYSFVINDKYLLSMYSDQGDRAKYKGYRNRFYNKMITILKDSNIFQSSITENKVLDSLFSFADSIENELV